METQCFKEKIGFEETLSRSQTKIYKGESVTLKRCNALALGDFREILKIILYGYSLKKLRSLPTKLPNEF